MKSLKEHLSSQAYYLTYESKPVPTFVVHIRPDIVKYLEDNYPLNTYRTIQSIGEKIGVNDFETSFDKNLGYAGGSANNRGIVDAHLELAFPIGHSVKFLDEPCEKCEGTGMDDFFKERICWQCRGTKKKLADDNSFRTVWSSIEILIRYLRLYRKSPELLEQDIEMNCMVDGRISDAFLERLIAYFQKKEAEGITERSIMGPDYAEVQSAVDAMSEVWNHIDLRSDDKTYVEKRKIDYVGQVSRHGGFLVQCPGNRTYVALFRHKEDDRESKYGHETMNHNIDTHYQELTLLIGFTVLYHEILKETLS